jgi:hypothetical protein
LPGQHKIRPTIEKTENNVVLSKETEAQIFNLLEKG